MKTTLISILLATMCFLVACSKPTKTSTAVQTNVVVSDVLKAKIGDFVFDEQGRKYKKITNEALDVSTGISKIDIWERIEPLDKPRWYTPTLVSKTFLDKPISFNSLYRLPGEDVPVF